MTSKDKKPVRKKFMATKEMKQLIADYYYDLDSAVKSSDKKVTIIITRIKIINVITFFFEFFFFEIIIFL